MNRLAALHRRVRRAVLARRRMLAAVLVVLAVLAGLRSVSPPPPAAAPAVVAARDLPSGQVLGPEDVAVVDLPPDAVPAGAVASPARLVGRTTAAPLRRGEAVTDVRVVAPSLLDGYPGLVAVPIRLGDAATLPLLSVGDRIDVVAADPQGRRADVVASGVPVVAIPQSPAREDGLVSGGLVVVAASPSDAERLAAAGVSAFLSPVLTE
jgi:Flp pilus assembly protein CpaB